MSRRWAVVAFDYKRTRTPRQTCRFLIAQSIAGKSRPSFPTIYGLRSSMMFCFRGTIHIRSCRPAPFTAAKQKAVFCRRPPAFLFYTFTITICKYHMRHVCWNYICLALVHFSHRTPFPDLDSTSMADDDRAQSRFRSDFLPDCKIPCTGKSRGRERLCRHQRECERKSPSREPGRTHGGRANGAEHDPAADSRE